MTYSEYEILFDEVDPSLKKEFENYAEAMDPPELALFLNVVTEMVAGSCYSPCDTAYEPYDRIRRETQTLIRHKLRCLVYKLAGM